MTEADGTSSHRLYRFLEADADGVRFGGGPCEPSGEPLGPLRDRVCTWTELPGHASYPAATTRIDRDRWTSLPDASTAFATRWGTATRCRRCGSRASSPVRPVKVVEMVSGEVTQTTELGLHRPG